MWKVLAWVYHLTEEVLTNKTSLTHVKNVNQFNNKEKDNGNPIDTSTVFLVRGVA